MFERIRGRQGTPYAETSSTGEPVGRDERPGPGDGLPDERLGPGDGRREVGPSTWDEEDRTGATAVREGDLHEDRSLDRVDDREEIGRSDTAVPATSAPAVTDVLAERRDRERARYGGMDWPASFFGWLVAVGIAALLVALLSAAGTAVGLTNVNDSNEVTSNADTIGIIGGILLIAVLLLAYFAGGYVAGRMARFDGARQGFGVWAIALLVTIVLAVAGVVLGAKYNVLDQLNLPRIPIDEGSLTTGAAIALAAIVIGTLLAAVAGGKVGTHYHRKVDRFGAGVD